MWKCGNQQSRPHTFFPFPLVINSMSMSTDEIKRRIDFFDTLAANFSWSKLKIKTENNAAQRQRYKRMCEDDGDEEDSYIIIDVWPTTGTIGSYLRHPRQGKRTQLFRKECTDEEAIAIFDNPRSHTGKGYHRKDENNIPSSSSSDPTVSGKTKRGRDEVTEDMATTTSDDDGDDGDDVRHRNKRRQVACVDGQNCRNWSCTYYHSPRCFYAAFCWFQPNCWFDHTHGLCRYGEDCTREDCWFSHRNPNSYY